MIDRSGIERIIKSEILSDTEKIDALIIKMRQAEHFHNNLVRRIEEEVKPIPQVIKENIMAEKKKEVPLTFTFKKIAYKNISEQSGLKKEKKMTVAKDMYGNEIKTGDYINYPGRYSSSIYMRTAKVLNIETKMDSYNKEFILIHVVVLLDFEEGQVKPRIKKTSIYCLDRTTIIPKSYVENDLRYATLVNT